MFGEAESCTNGLIYEEYACECGLLVIRIHILIVHWSSLSLSLVLLSTDFFKGPVSMNIFDNDRSSIIDDS